MVLNFPVLPFRWFQYMNIMALKAGPELISKANSQDWKDWSSSLMLLSPQLFHKMLTQCHHKIFINSLIPKLNNYVMQSEWGGSIGGGLLRIQMGALCSWTQLIELESCGGGSGGWGVYGDHGLHDINASWWMLLCGWRWSWMCELSIDLFLPLFSPLTRHNGQVKLGLPDSNHCSKSTCPLCKSWKPEAMWNILH